MSNSPDAEGLSFRNQLPAGAPLKPGPFLLADDMELEQVQVELIDCPVTLETPQFKALVADTQCEV